MLDPGELEDARRGVLRKIGTEFAKCGFERIDNETVLELLLGHFEELGFEAFVLHRIEAAGTRAGDGFAFKARALAAEKKFGTGSEEGSGVCRRLEAKVKTRRRAACENLDQRKRRDGFRQLQTGFAGEDDFFKWAGLEFLESAIDGFRPTGEIRLVPAGEHAWTRRRAGVAKPFDPLGDIGEIGFVIREIDCQRGATAGADDLGFWNEEIFVRKIGPITAVVRGGIKATAAKNADARIAVVEDFEQVGEAPEGCRAHGERLVAARA